jgi:hypothetical protein
VKSAVDEIVLPQLSVTVQFFAAGAVDDAAEEIRCGWCGTLFYVHRSCFRGHGYCSAACRHEGNRRRCRKARDNYRRSVEAREDNRDRNREFRARRRTCVMDHGSRKLDSVAKSVPEPNAGEERRVPRRGFVICAVCGGECRAIVVRHRRRRARDPP